MDQDELYAFLRDPDLTELIETNKTTDDLLEIFNLTENQHSDLLAWCMNPNEGHSQGDGVIKDFLEAGYEYSGNAIWDNKRFFAKWTPGKIRTSSFGAAFITREFRIDIEEGTKKGRLDLFLVDPQNKILIAIENKAGASVTNEQLEKYALAIKSEITSKRAFSEYDLALIVLDRELGAYSDEDISALDKRWTLLDYSWLEASAKRARFQLARDKNSGQLLVAYCQRQTDWESPAEKRSSELAADLVLTHPRVIESLRQLKNQPLNSWTSKALESYLGELTIFRAQHQHICEKLVGIRAIATIARQLLRALPTLKEALIEQKRTSLNATPIEIRSIIGDDEDLYWPIYINIALAPRSSRPDSPKFNLQLIWVRSEFNPSICEEASLRTHFEKNFSDLKKFATSDVRKITIETSLNSTETVAAAARLLIAIEEGIKSYSKKASDQY